MRRLLPTVLALGLLLAGCGDDDAGDGDSGATTTTAADGSATTGAGDGGDGGSDGGDDGSDPAATGPGGGELTLGDEQIELDSSQCFLEEQEAAAGGGKILFVAQAFGKDAAGDQVVVDVSRFDEDSQFVGDAVDIVIGDPLAEETVEYRSTLELGTVTVEGSTVSLASATLTNLDTLEDIQVALTIDC